MTSYALKRTAFIIGTITIILLIKLEPYSAVYTSPQYLYAKNPPLISGEFLINRNVFNAKDFTWDILLRPQSKLNGVKELVLTGKTEKIGLELLIDFTEDPYLSNFWVSTEKDWYGGVQNDYKIKCDNKPEMLFNRKMFPLSDVHFENKKLHQGKYFRWDTTLTSKPLQIPDLYHCPNDDDSIAFEIRALNLVFDTELIYEWSSKGGTTYRL